MVKNNFMNKLNQKIIIFFCVSVWIGFSIGYIIIDQLQESKSKQVEKAYKTGGSNAVEIIINEAKKCKPVSLFSGEKKIKVVAVECLRENQFEQVKNQE
ncbi:MAG: hypothetical protein K8S00_07970 [Bacteroidales bacterium]|nr:hypothetical protein [Bacteroidales bacterium]